MKELLLSEFACLLVQLNNVVYTKLGRMSIVGVSLFLTCPICSQQISDIWLIYETKVSLLNLTLILKSARIGLEIARFSVFASQPAG